MFASRNLFGYIENHQFKIGCKHRYMTKNARERFFAISKDYQRRQGWCGRDIPFFFRGKV